MRNMRKPFLRLFLLLILGINCTINNISAGSKSLPIISYADVIEPLLPTVVNIYTVTYSKKSISNNLFLSELLLFLKQFNMPSTSELFPNSKVTYLGSGFIIDETGLIVTNHHVVAGCDEIHIKLSDNREFSAEIVGTDPKTDLALIKIDASINLPFVTFGDSSAARVGDVVIAIGNPLGFGGTVTTGIISFKGRDLDSGVDKLIDDFIQTDAAINIGNSGGPLFNMEGKVIGATTSIPDAGKGINIGIGFAIPSNKIQNIIEQLKTSGKISRGKLDIAIQEINQELSSALNIDKDYGVLVTDVTPGGAGDLAGLKTGDLIIEFNNQKILNSRKLQLFVANAHIEEEVKLTIIRNEKTLTLKAIIAEVTENDLPTAEHDLPPSQEINNKNLLEKSNIIFTNLTEDLKIRFNIEKNIQGLCVIGVKPSNIKLDLRVGDVILELNKEAIDNIEQFNLIYEKLKSKDKKNAILLVKRQNFSMFIALPVQ